MLLEQPVTHLEPVIVMCHDGENSRRRRLESLLTLVGSGTASPRFPAVSVDAACQQRAICRDRCDGIPWNGVIPDKPPKSSPARELGAAGSRAQIDPHRMVIAGVSGSDRT